MKYELKLRTGGGGRNTSRVESFHYFPKPLVEVVHHAGLHVFEFLVDDQEEARVRGRGRRNVVFGYFVERHFQELFASLGCFRDSQMRLSQHLFHVAEVNAGRMRCPLFRCWTDKDVDAENEHLCACGLELEGENGFNGCSQCLLKNRRTLRDITEGRRWEKFSSYLNTSSSGMSSCLVPTSTEWYSRQFPVYISHFGAFAMFKHIPAMRRAVGFTWNRMSMGTGLSLSWSITSKRSSLISVSRNLKLRGLEDN